MALSIIRELLHYGQTGIFEENAEYKIQGKTYIIHNNKFEYLGKSVDGRKYWSDIIYIMNRGINKIQTGSTVDDTIQALDNDIEDAINNQLNEKFKNIWRERRNNYLLGLDKLKEHYRHELANLVNYIVGPEIHSSRKGKNFEYIKVFIYLSYISRFDILSKLVRKYTKIFNRAVLMLLKNSDKFKSYGIPINMLKYDAVLRRDGIIEYTLSLKDINTMKEE